MRNALVKLQLRPDIDLFASRINHLFPKYVSYRLDPDAFAIDAFSLQWSHLYFNAFPPFSVIPAVLSKIHQERTQGVVVLPDWSAQSWYPKAMEILILTLTQFTSKQGGSYYNYPVIQRKYT